MLSLFVFQKLESVISILSGKNSLDPDYEGKESRVRLKERWLSDSNECLGMPGVLKP